MSGSRNPPLVTIGMTCFNAEDTIERAVASAERQSWPNKEIVIVDDMSRDGSWEILCVLARRNPAIRLLRNPMNSGMATGLNGIIEAAKGEFLAFFDDDDESLPGRLEAQWRRIVQYEAAFARGGIVVCHTARRQRYPDGRERIEPTMGAKEGRVAPNGMAVARRILMGTPLKDGYGACASCSQMARVSTYRAVGGYNPSLRRRSDTDFTIRLAKAGGHFAGIAEPLVVQTMTKAEKNFAEDFRNVKAMLDLHRDTLEAAGQYGFCRRWVEAKQAWLEGQMGAFALTAAGLAARHPVLTLRRALLATRSLGAHRAESRAFSREGR